MPDELLRRNEIWAATTRARDPEFFVRSAVRQRPRRLWIGCSDSRQPAATISGAGLGELFVHRNIANLCVHSDLSMLSVLEYAVKVLEVEHIIVCGHHGCGGVAAALRGQSVGIIDNWLRHIRDVHLLHQAQIDTIEDPQARLDRLCELNAIQQASNVAQSSIVQAAWASGRKLRVHAWIYRLRDGQLRDLGARFACQQDVEPAYRLSYTGIGSDAEA